MNIIARKAGTPGPSRRWRVLVSAALLALAPVGALVSQEAPKPTAPAPSQPAAKTETPATTKPSASAPAATADKTATTPAAKGSPESAKPAAAAAQSESDAGAVDESQAPKRFIPTQKSSADNSATFPIDI